VAISHDDDNITEIIRRADDACYQAKAGGRNRIHSQP
jgi:PleD family two-component response regulator